ncbi:hypothetical protein JSO54_05395 [Riemerella anatipestifer]|uniref:hypothetical protein n=1 Tax=Riemerella anatipestifer TaxID=34085 RepID=UPI001374D9B6|nr:hypothetical protein [Riemerella anatipestifer]
MLKIANEDGITEKDALIYMNTELKKKLGRRETRREIIETVSKIGGVVVSVGTFVLSVLAAKKGGSGKK